MCIIDSLSSAGHNITLVTPASVVSPWTKYTLEQERIQTTLLNQGVNLILNKTLVHAHEGSVDARCVYTQRVSQIPCKTLVLVTERFPETTLYEQLMASTKGGSLDTQRNIEFIGDAVAPGLIADAI